MTNYKDSNDTMFFIVAILILIITPFAINGCRNYRINACENRGGEAVVPPWFSESPTAVSCIIP